MKDKSTGKVINFETLKQMEKEHKDSFRTIFGELKDKRQWYQYQYQNHDGIRNLSLEAAILIDFGMKQVRRALRESLQPTRKARWQKRLALLKAQPIEILTEQEKKSFHAKEDNPRIKKIFGAEYGKHLAVSVIVYEDISIQSFFEFSLLYAYFKFSVRKENFFLIPKNKQKTPKEKTIIERQKKLFVKEAKELFILAEQIKLGIPLENEKTRKVRWLKNYFDFKSGVKPILDNRIINKFKGGRPEKPSEKNKKTLKLGREGRSHWEIAQAIKPELKFKNSPESLKEVARIGTYLRRKGVYKRKKKTT